VVEALIAALLSRIEQEDADALGRWRRACERDSPRCSSTRRVGAGLQLVATLELYRSYSAVGAALLRVL
jgi:hypothetical protein